MAKKRKRRGGTGSVITLRRLKGVGSLRKPSSFAGSAIPALIGGGVTGLATLATRYWAKPSEGENPLMLFKWAPALGLGGGILSSVALYWLGGAPAMISSLVSSVMVSASMLAHDYLLKSTIGEFALAHPAPQTEGSTAGLGVIVPNRIGTQGVGAMMLESAASRDPVNRYGVHGTGSYGQEVTLQGITPTAFGRTHLGR